MGKEITEAEHQRHVKFDVFLDLARLLKRHVPTTGMLDAIVKAIDDGDIRHTSIEY